MLRVVAHKCEVFTRVSSPHGNNLAVLLDSNGIRVVIFILGQLSNDFAAPAESCIKTAIAIVPRNGNVKSFADPWDASRSDNLAVCPESDGAHYARDAKERVGRFTTYAKGCIKTAVAVVARDGERSTRAVSCGGRSSNDDLVDLDPRCAEGLLQFRKIRLLSALL